VLVVHHCRDSRDINAELGYSLSIAVVDEDLEESTAIFSLGSFRPSQVAKQRLHVLIRMEGSDIGKVVSLVGTEFSIGRRSECSLVLKYEGVSRNHAQISLRDGVYILEDLGSANGTLVQGRKVQRHRLQDGDVLQFGPLVSFRYSITDAEETDMMNQLYEASVRDSLTGAYNREYLSERLNSEIAFALRHKSDTSLIMFDLDHFKRVNDGYGHQAGDLVLVEVCKQVAASLRTEDVLARYGGEEFAISVRGIDRVGTAQLAERLRVGTHRSIRFQDSDIPISASVGCAMLNECEGEPTAEKLIAIADRRLYLAKHGGRNRVVSAG
jgi:two-component system, cell cycle response regulator